MPLPSLADEILTVLFRRVARLNAAFLRSLVNPTHAAPFGVRLIREEGPMLFYKVNLPPPVDADVVTRELSVFVNGVTDPTMVVEVTDATELSFNQGDNVSLVLTDVDDAGNRSAPSAALSFVATDSLAPQQPGDMTVELVREDSDTVPPEPTP